MGPKAPQDQDLVARLMGIGDGYRYLVADLQGDKCQKPHPNKRYVYIIFRVYIFIYNRIYIYI